MSVAGRMSEWLGACEPGAEVLVRVRFPDLGWEVDDWAFEVSGPPDAPVITASVWGADFDYPDVVRRLKALVDRAAWYNFVG